MFITSPIFYVNGKPHLGHLYTSFAVDILTRWEKLHGRPAFLSIGTDEHGQKVAAAAEKQGQSPKEYVDKTHIPFKEMLLAADIQYNVFIRTTDETHKKTATYIWNKLTESGLTYESSYEGWYSKTDEAYYKDTEVSDGHAIETGSPVEYMKESCIFFCLSAMKDKLIEFYTNNPETVQPKSKFSEVMGLLKADLPDLSISRTRFNWGVPVPNHPEHVMYVWIDALTNYLTALNYPRNDRWMDYWRNSVHIIGKDILKFHTIYWPAFLLAVDLPPPSRIFAHGWWSVNDQKMSKSLGNVVDPFELIQKYGADAMRYVMFSELNFGQDGNFHEESLQHAINVQLANELGNLVQRVSMFCYSKFGRTIGYDTATNGQADILLVWDHAKQAAARCMELQDISGYLNECRHAIIETNKYIEHSKPWSSANPEEILGILCLCIQRLSLIYSPLLPSKCAEISNMFGLTCTEINEDTWNRHIPYPLKKPEPCFQRK